MPFKPTTSTVTFYDEDSSLQRLKDGQSAYTTLVGSDIGKYKANHVYYASDGKPIIAAEIKNHSSIQTHPLRWHLTNKEKGILSGQSYQVVRFDPYN